MSCGQYDHILAVAVIVLCELLALNFLHNALKSLSFCFEERSVSIRNGNVALLKTN